MPTVKKRITLAANGVNENVLSGSAYEYVGRASQITVALAKNSAGGTVDADVQVGPELLTESSNVDNEQGVGFGPLVPENLVVQDMAAAGDRVIVRLRETGGTGADVGVMVRIEAV